MVLSPSAKGWRPAGAAVAPRAGAPSAALRLLSAVRCAHKGPEIGNAVRTQGRDQAVVRDAVLRNSVPCVRNTGNRAPRKSPPAPPDASSREPETLGPGPASANTVSGGAPCAATIQGCRGALAAPVGRCTGGGRGCLSH